MNNVPKPSAICCVLNCFTITWCYTGVTAFKSLANENYERKWVFPICTFLAARFLHGARNLCHFNLRLNALRWGRWCRRPSWSGCRPACGSRRCGPRARRSGSRGPCWCLPSGSSSSPTGREPTGRRRTATTWTLSAWTEQREAAEDKLVITTTSIIITSTYGRMSESAKLNVH